MKAYSWFKPKNKQNTTDQETSDTDLQGVLIIDATPDEEVKTMIEEVIQDSSLDI